ncbi:hypothetical protein C7271_03575 [filamentous cyanobacterium CCP5]|nr:hypothetical protein C7271_03575 [filamentous cyanobacterium CCP5]
MFGKVSLARVLLTVGGILTIIGFVAYFQGNSTLNLVGFFYGVPVFLGGLALQAAQLEPAPYSKPTPPEVLKLREEQATPTQNQVRKDVTRYRYGQSAHLEESLERIGVDPAGDDCPQLEAIREEEIDGCYALILEFASGTVPIALWQEKREKIERFFGPNVRAEVIPTGQTHLEVALITRLEADTLAADQATAQVES